MKRVVSKFGAYTSHLAALSKDRSLRPADRAKLNGYYSKWTDAKYLLGCALFVDLLMPCTTFSKCMQSDEVDILGALNALLKTLRETDKLASKPLDQWLTYTATLAKCASEGGDTVYQLQKLKRYPQALSYYSSKYKEYCSAVSEHIKSRLSWSDFQLMRDIIFMLSSHGWEKAIEEEDDLAAIERLAEQFATPLLGAEANTNAIKEEFADMIEYAVQYIAVSSLDTTQCGGNCSMRQIQQIGRMLSSLLSYFSPFQHPMGNLSECFLHLLLLRLTSVLVSVMNLWMIYCY